MKRVDVNVSRRRFICALPAAVALAACTQPETPQRHVIDVRDHGAVGDGIADDSAAIRAAAAALEPGSTLVFPQGTYRFAEQRPQTGAAVRIDGISDLVVEFEPGAELLMDNVDPATNLGTSHGFLIHGPAANIAFRNVRIRWAHRASRSMGDGIRILGCPTDSQPPAGWDGPPRPVNNIELTNCEIRSSPQTGAIMNGVSDITVTGLRVLDTAADGLHFNACRRVKVDDYVARNNGDDGLALVTYFADEFSYDRAAETFAFPTLTDWSNADFTATNVDVSEGLANGARIAGAHRVSIRNFTATRKPEGSGVTVDSATVESDPIWHYVASRDIRLEGITVEECSIGIQVLARPPADAIDPRFTDFDVEVVDAVFRNCTNWGLQAESLTDQRVTGLRLGSCTVEAVSTEGGRGGVGLHNADNITLGSVSVTHAHSVTAFLSDRSDRLAIDRLQLTINGPAQPDTPLVPCAHFVDSAGTVDVMDVTWQQAPQDWTPVQVTSSGVACVAPDAPAPPLPVAIRSLTVVPPRPGSAIATC
ncbi:right-handed parallel beta-helix repeat-containing protein [Mycolicibacterium baixiangningiae]|uniref:right-handed parallel beta-helix repeat-containing protein n=1 Tax=Mycolicibacterium baixiangningiae TaxID=2761578 RepID=UPI0018688698|nr:right-handed parallel beta-helix repeat-containing protein [Mycolicibacterium baixiangningiae]